MEYYSLILRRFFFTCLSVLIVSTLPAQTAAIKENLFDSDELINITITGSVKDLLNDRTNEATYFPFDLSFIDNGSSELTIPVQMKTRGNFRRLKANCKYPPLLIRFQKDGVYLQTIFYQQLKLKLVMPCVGDDYIIKEWLVYKLYNLVSPLSFKARLVKVTLKEKASGKNQGPVYGLLLEEEKQMAQRNHLEAIDINLQPQQIEPKSFLTMAVFQYLIGNTDWSTQYQQNIKILLDDATGSFSAVPYDFDHAGLVNAPYAHPAQALEMTSVRERRFRGYCIKDLSLFDSVIALYRYLQADIYRLYTNNSLLDTRSKASTTKFLDEFFKTINTDKLWQKDFSYPCDKNGTGNVVIKGLKEN